MGRNERKGCFFVPVFGGRLHEVGIGCWNLAKDAMRHFLKKLRTVRSLRVPKDFWRNCFGKNMMKSIIAEVEIFVDGILREGRERRDGKPASDLRGMWGWVQVLSGRVLNSRDHSRGTKQIRFFPLSNLLFRPRKNVLSEPDRFDIFFFGYRIRDSRVSRI